MHLAPVRTWMGPTDAFVHLDTVSKMTSVKVGGLQYLEMSKQCKSPYYQSQGFCDSMMEPAFWNSLSNTNARAEGVIMACNLDGETRTSNSHANP